MDHDDADFQNQNFQLAGEDNSKFSLVLRPFALPKLDIDDQLQNHLRFDNLVDSEVFFSVQGHGNSWIEDLSTGSSIVDFSSSAAESCTLPKITNVWSEATTTESVEVLLKSVGESEMAGNIDGSACNQLSGMDSQIDLSNKKPKSSNSPIDSTAVPIEEDQLQSTCSGMTGGPEHAQSTHTRMTDNPSGTQSQPDHFGPFQMDGKDILSEKLPSSHKTSESCSAAGNYFQSVIDDSSLDRSAELDSRKLNNETFPELAPLQNIYVTDSYHFEHVNQDSEVGVLQDSKSCHIKENKVEGGLHDLRNLSRTGQPFGAVSSHVSNESLLPGSSDGLLESVTNPVKMLQRNVVACKSVSDTLQSSFFPGQQTTEGLKSSVDMSNNLCKEFGIGSNSALSHQFNSNLRNSNPHHVTSISIESSKTKSPERKLDHRAGVSEETNNAGANNRNIFCGDESKHKVLGPHQGSVDNPNIGAVEEKNSAVSGNMKQMVHSDHEENATGVTYPSKNDKFDSSDNIAPDTFHTSENPNVPLVKHEGSFKEGDRSALEEGPENTQLVLTGSGLQEEISPPLTSSSSHIISTIVTDTFSGSKDKNDCSGNVSPDDSSAVLPAANDSRMSTMNHEDSFKGNAKSALDNEGHNVISSGSETGAEILSVSMNANTDPVCSGDASVAKEDMEHAISLDRSTTLETQDKSGNHPDVHAEKCQTGGSIIQSEPHIDIAMPSTLGTSSEKTVEKILETPLKARDDLDKHVQDTVLNCGTDHSPGSVLPQGKLGSNVDVSCAGATNGSSSVISCTEPFPKKVEHGGRILSHQTPMEQPENVTDNEAPADRTQKSEQCSNRNAESNVASTEVAAGDDRSFSFEVGSLPNVSEKAHCPAWSPFPRFSASQSAEVTTGNPQPEGSWSSNKSSDDSKKTSVTEAGKEQLPQRKSTESSARPSHKSKIGNSTEVSPPKPSPQHSIPECSDLVNLPFTDSQHVQLRAQIFVYGALIQGTPPGEAYMVAAFGEPGGGNPTWKAAWQSALERFQYQKSTYNGLETPTSSRLGSVSEKSKGTAVKIAPASKKGGKTVLPAHSAVALNSPTAPPSSSTFNLQRGTHLDFSQAVSPLIAYSSHMMHPSGVASWYPQNPGPRPAPWLVQPQNVIFNSLTQAAVPTNETSKGPSSKDISVSNAVSPGVFLPSPAPPIVSPLAVVHEENQKASTSSSKGTSSQKPRKRKKASTTASPVQQAVVASPQLTTDMVSFTPSAKHASGFTLSTHSPSNVLSSGLVPNIGQITSAPNYQVTGSMDAEQRIVLLEQVRGAIEQSTGQAKGANLHSMEAVRHKESVWSHLSTISRNKITPEVEEKLTSAAAAAEAAVSVAKAAAEAAKMASEAALRAKIMAEEALNSSKSANSLQNLGASEFNMNNPPSLLSSSPASSWKTMGNSHAPGSIVSVAREVARKRVEEASAAAKRAENLDAILKAAELAAEAVFNAGTIIGMGEPLPFTLSELLEAGPDGFWKFERVRNVKAGNGNGNLLTETLSVDVSADINRPSKKRGRKPKSDQSQLNSEPSSSARELQPDGVPSERGVKDVLATVSVDGISNDMAPKTIIWNGIEKGSAVEVSSNVGGFGVAWFSAKVVDMNEDSALISYDNHNDGARPHEEWVLLKLEGDKAPRIRLAHPATLSKFKTRKRRRETTGTGSWAIGDHVDAWFNDRWREGVIAQNLEADKTKFVVQFPDASGTDSLVVDAWNLRPSLVWKDGRWTEWSRSRERKSKSNKGDSPLEKRQRTDSLQAGSDNPVGGETGGPSKDKITDNSKKPEELRPLALSQRDMIFNIGKSLVENKNEALAFKRPGLQKEGSRVVYGVPKHGKKKKFMEVSKHYVLGQSNKISEDNAFGRVASSRAVKQMVPPLPRSRDNTSKTEQRGRRVGGTRSRGPPKHSKSQTIAANTIPDKDSLSMPAPNHYVFERNFASMGSTTSTSNTEKSTTEKNKAALGPVPGTEDLSVSEMEAAPIVPTSKQDVPATSRTKRQHVPSVDNRSLRKTSERPDSAEPQRTSSDSAEPRRSNRRIQPTSRLLEGLQSSLAVSKVPGEKGPRSHFRSTASRGRAHG